MKLNRIIALILALASLLFLSACGEYKPATGGGKLPQGSVEQPPLDDDPTNNFTVQLMLNGKPFIPMVNMSVYWSDGHNIHIAPVDSNGLATIDGLDGDYGVTLSNVPSGYAYDPNSNVATNDNRNITLELYDLNMLRGSGTGLYQCYQINSTGVYTVTIKNAGDLSYIQFAPRANGTYTVESWVNVIDDDVSPICMAYLGSSQYKYGEYKVTDVGVCGSFTRNFVHTVNIADENISSAGSQTFTFAVGAEAKSGVYPLTLTFAVKRNGDFDLDLMSKTTVIPTQDWSAFDFDAFNALAGKKIVGAETLYPGTTDSYMFDEDNYKIWPISEGGDGVYHLFDEEKYASTDGYGPVLVAYVSKPCRYTDAPFTTIESVGNNALVVNGTHNYRVLIRGIEDVAKEGYYCLTDCPCHSDGSPLVCPPGCTKCNPSCTPCPKELWNVKGYASLCNADGVVPVTQELKEFLQGFAVTQRYFADGAGWVETNSDAPIDAYEDSQWLFACGYYAN